MGLGMDEARIDSGLDNSEYSKEFGYLNQLRQSLDFSIFNKPGLCKSNFFSTIAWYIELLKKENSNNREEKMQELIDKTKTQNFVEMFRDLDKFLSEKQIEWHEAMGSINAKLLRIGQNRIDDMYKILDDEKFPAVFPGILPDAIPERYKLWLQENGIEENVDEYNRRTKVKDISNVLNQQKISDIPNQ
ncbi:MAG TPA: hypothetical protein PK674_01640 [Candidatus Absconditabacterales bacterium]|nr:hypothetical protein [Candidatus Absconditabacterales bacterium]HOQ78822.1 hypothetical protein [Candidatus Absconditabacterales bacterium]